MCWVLSTITYALYTPGGDKNGYCSYTELNFVGIGCKHIAPQHWVAGIVKFCCEHDGKHSNNTYNPQDDGTSG